MTRPEKADLRDPACVTMPAASTDAALDALRIEQIRRGDEEAFAAMVRACYARLVDFALSYTRSAPAAEDLVQDVLAHVWEHRARWQPATTAQAYLFRAVRNRALNYRRDRKARFQDDVATAALPVLSAGPDDDVQYRMLVVAYRAAVEELPERRRLVFRLSRLYGLTYAEIGAVLDVSVNTVRTQMAAALAHLRDQLGPHLE